MKNGLTHLKTSKQKFDKEKVHQNIINVCKIGQGILCCKYLVMGQKGFECMKIDPENKKVIDENWKTVKHVAQGDNCEGKTDNELNCKK